MLRYIIIVLSFFALVNIGYAQNWMGFHSSNYAGIHGVQFQPASIADSRYKFQINLIGANAYTANNYYRIPNSDFTSFDIARERLISNDDGTDKGALMTFDIHAPLSFMLTLSPKHAIAVSGRLRGAINNDGVNDNFAGFIDRAIKEEEIRISNDEQYDLKNSYTQGNVWLEVGLTYARVVLNSGSHFLKAGATGKLLSGAAAGFTYVNDLSFAGNARNIIDIGKLDIASGLSKNFEGLSRDELTSLSSYNIFGRTSTALDAGLVYERRPDPEQFIYEMDGVAGKVRRDLNKYKYKIGVSVLDIGKIHYDKSDDTGNITGDLTDFDVNDYKDRIKDVRDVREVLDSLFDYIPGGKFVMGLPARVTGEIDYHFFKGLYLNLTGQVAIERARNRRLSGITLTPRIEGPKNGVALPISYDKYSKLVSGISLRLGPVVIGSRDVISNFILGKEVTSTDVHVGIRFGIPYKKEKDRDEDSVSDELDECIDIPGIWELRGCPEKDSVDTDGDGVIDEKDKCPEEAGSPELDGCPDTDEDGVPDIDDLCPEEAGLPEHDGCPDNDGDGVADVNDDCPDKAGPPESGGCPDSDNDGILDKDDDCPDEAGDAEGNGCPESKNDSNDAYSQQMADNTYDYNAYNDETADRLSDTDMLSDADGDGIPDRVDNCPTTYGVSENDGCPKLRVQDALVLQTAFENLEFDFNSAVISKSSYQSLIDLAILLHNNPGWRVRIDGHADQIGSRKNNMIISRRRAESVARFLMEHGGLDRGMFLIRVFGPDRPIANNWTAYGRQRNRRVELKIINE